MKQFVLNYVEGHFMPLPADSNLSVEQWLADNQNYPLWRKQEMLSAWENSGCACLESDYLVKNFCKVETYTNRYKHARGINSRSDIFKCYTGPFFSAIERVVYSNPAFIKHVPVRNRPQYITNILAGHPGPYYESDYSQFEKHFTPAIMENIEFVLYEHMLKNFPEVFRVISQAMSGVNHCTNKFFTIKIRGRRMSGEMCTSLGNGFTNLMLAMFVAHEKGGSIVGVVEGDDGLFASNVDLSSEDFVTLGFDIKMEARNTVLESKFCGLMMSQDLISLADPRKILVNFGWSHSPLICGGTKLKLRLLRAKALSLCYEHPQSPVVVSLAVRIIELTSHLTPYYDGGWWERNLHREMNERIDETMGLVQAGPSECARVDFERIYGVSVTDQIHLENYFSTLPSLDLEMDDPVLLGLFGHDYDDARDYYLRFTSEFGTI